MPNCARQSRTSWVRSQNFLQNKVKMGKIKKMVAKKQQKRKLKLVKRKIKALTLNVDILTCYHHFSR